MSERHHARYKWWSQLVRHPNATHHRHISPRYYSWMGLASGVRGGSFNYTVTRKESSAEFYIDRGRDLGHENLHVFDHLYAKNDQIESAFRGQLSWERLEGKRACRIRAPVQGGYSDPEENWEETHGRMTDAMNRLVDAIRPHFKTLRIEDAIDSTQELGENDA